MTDLSPPVDDPAPPRRVLTRTYSAKAARIEAFLRKQLGRRTPEEKAARSTPAASELAREQAIAHGSRPAQRPSGRLTFVCRLCELERHVNRIPRDRVCAKCRAEMTATRRGIHP